jgi:hypothetical protein|tara:strand:- start:1652 stop:1876 length:225 start_codon:yes stop_codon:yes gene_type:complete
MVEWLKSVVPEEEQEKVTLENVHTYIPEQTHVYGNRSLHVSAYTLRWFIKGIKKLIKQGRQDYTTIKVQELEHG